MTLQHPIRGGEAIGTLDSMAPEESAAIMLLRLWCDGPDGQAQVWTAMSDKLGPAAGSAALKSFERLLALCLGHGRRPLQRHGVDCRCAGADECWFARLIDAAAEGDREDAMMLAVLMVRADVASCVVGFAEQVGLSLRRMNGHLPDLPPRRAELTRTLH